MLYMKRGNQKQKLMKTLNFRDGSVGAFVNRAIKETIVRDNAR